MRNTSAAAASAAAALHAAVLPFHLAHTSPSPPALFLPCFLLSPLSSLFRNTRSLKVSFACAAAVRRLFERQLPSGRKNLQLTLSPLCPPPSPLSSIHLSSFASPLSLLSAQHNRFLNPSIENSHLHWLPFQWLTLILSLPPSWPLFARGGDETVNGWWGETTEQGVAAGMCISAQNATDRKEFTGTGVLPFLPGEEKILN